MERSCKQILQIFRSSKKTTPHNNNNNNNNKKRVGNVNLNNPTPSITQQQSKPSNWSVYLIISTNPPIKTYVGSTSNFSRRLKQHNGGLRGAKATRAGKPWVCACLIRGFVDQSEACVFESKWKSISKKLPRKRKKTEEGKPPADGSLILLQHRLSALNRVKCLIDCTHLEIDWQLSPS